MHESFMWKLLLSCTWKLQCKLCVWLYAGRCMNSLELLQGQSVELTVLEGFAVLLSSVTLACR